MTLLGERQHAIIGYKMGMGSTQSHQKQRAAAFPPSRLAVMVDRQRGLDSHTQVNEGFGKDRKLKCEDSAR